MFSSNLINRVRLMRPGEIPLRVLELGLDFGRYAFSHLLKPRVPAQDFRAPFPSCNEQTLSSIWERNAWHGSALQTLLDQHIDINGIEYPVTGANPWVRCPDRKHELDMGLGRLFLFHRMYAEANMDYIGTLNRHYHLVHLAKAARLGRINAQIIIDIMHDWIDKNPYMAGVNWSDTLNFGMRLVNWCVALGIAGLDHVDEKIAGSLHQQGLFVEKHLSFGSSAANHLLGELCGLYFLARCFPGLPRASRWRRIADDRLARELQRQFTSEGMHREQSLSYHRYLMEYFLLMLMCDRHLEEPSNTLLHDTTRRGLFALAQFVNGSGEVPFIGDHGHEITTDIHYQAFRYNDLYLSVLRMGALYFAEPALKPGIAGDELRLPWLVDEAGLQQLANMPENNARQVSFAMPEAGFYFLRDNEYAANATAALVRCGPMGFPTTYAHAHADMLSITLSVRGRQFLIDPGTYGYHIKGSKWRNWFKGTSAHNTLQVDALDQARNGGAMMWLTAADGRPEHWKTTDAFDEFQGRHDGYADSDYPVSHHRRVRMSRGEQVLFIDDWLHGPAANDIPVALYFHFHPEVEVTAEAGRAAAVRAGDRIEIEYPAGLGHWLAFGDEERPAGWYSPYFTIRKPCHTLCLHGTIKTEQHMLTRISFKPES